MKSEDMLIDKEAPEGCWTWLGRTESTGRGGRTPAVGRGKRSVAQLVWLDLVGPLSEGDRLVRTCPNELCVNPEHRRVHNPAATTRAALERFDAGESVLAIEQATGLSERHVRRILRDRIPPVVRFVWTPELRERASRLLQDGVPALWVAEDVGAPADRVRRLARELGTSDGEWVKVQLACRKIGALAPLHDLFNPNIGLTL